MVSAMKAAGKEMKTFMKARRRTLQLVAYASRHVWLALLLLPLAAACVQCRSLQVAVTLQVLPATTALRPPCCSPQMWHCAGQQHEDREH